MDPSHHVAALVVAVLAGKYQIGLLCFTAEAEWPYVLNAALRSTRFRQRNTAQVAGLPFTSSDVVLDAGVAIAIANNGPNALQPLSEL